VREHDERTGQLVLDGTLAHPGEDGCRAVIECFALPPARRPDLAALRPAHPATTARGTVAVIGSSRGFGASLALALVGRGYDVRGVYKSAPARAAELEALAEELIREGGPAAGHLTLTRADAADPEAMAELADAAGAEPLAGIVLNAALPPLTLGLSAGSASALARYVSESVSLAAVPLGALAPQVQAGGFVLVCSSAAVQAPPRGWPHYVAAKSALEGLARWTAASRPALRTVIVRLPKMDTAMTATPSGRLGATSADVIAAAIADRLMSLEPADPLTILDPALEPVPA
jgi:NAD(P)-dependent dehydrogenase (short-subunit alcohol dehydrogenase family)